MINEPRRIQLSRKKGWRMPENTVVVSRRLGSPDWGNPFRIGIHGTAEECVQKYKAAWEMHDKDAQRIMTMSLRGKNLACWCKPGDPCHADVLLEIANS